MTQSQLPLESKQTTIEMDSLLLSLERNENDEAVQETLAEIKRHLIQSAEASKNVLNSSTFFHNANS